MRLTLQNGYPYPLPPGFDFDAHNPHMHFVGFDGVRHFEWLHTRQQTAPWAPSPPCSTAQKKLKALMDWQ